MRRKITGILAIGALVSNVSMNGQPLTWGCRQLHTAYYYNFLPSSSEFTFVKEDSSVSPNLLFFRTTQWVNASNNIRNRGMLDMTTAQFFYPDFPLKNLRDNLYVLLGASYSTSPPELTMLGIDATMIEPSLQFVLNISSNTMDLNNLDLLVLEDTSLLWLIAYYSPGNPYRDLDHLIAFRLKGDVINIVDTTVFMLDTTEYWRMYHSWFAFYAKEDRVIYLPGGIDKKDTLPFFVEGLLCTWHLDSNYIRGVMYWFDTSSLGLGYILLYKVKHLNDSLLITTFSFDKNGNKGKGIAIIDNKTLQPVEIWHFPQAKGIHSEPLADTLFYVVFENKDSSGISIVKMGVSGQVFSAHKVRRFGNETIQSLWTDSAKGLWIYFTDWDTLYQERVYFIYHHYPEQNKYTDTCCSIEKDSVIEIIPLEWEVISYDTLMTTSNVNLSLYININRDIPGILDDTLPPSFWTCGNPQYYEPVSIQTPNIQIEQSQISIYVQEKIIYFYSERMVPYSVRIYGLDGKLIKEAKCESNKLCKVNMHYEKGSLLLLAIEFKDGVFESHKISMLK